MTTTLPPRAWPHCPQGSWSAALRHVVTGSLGWALVALALIAFPAAAQTPSVFSRGSGFLEVPSAEALGAGGGLLGVEVRVDRAATRAWSAGPAQLNIAAGLGLGLEAGLQLREGGKPGDPDPAPLFVGGSFKWQFSRAEGFRPALAVEASVDRANWLVVTNLRALATLPLGPLRLSGVLGADLVDVRWRAIGPTGGLSLRYTHDVGLGLEGEWWLTPRGMGAAAEVRWRLTQNLALSTRATWLPGDAFWRFGLGLVVFAEPPPARQPVATQAPTAVADARGPKAFRDEAPRFRMRWRQSVEDVAARPTQWDGTGADPGPGPRVRPEAAQRQGPAAPAAPVEPFAVKPLGGGEQPTGGSWSENLRLVMKTVEGALRRCWGSGVPAGVGNTVDVALTVDLNGRATQLVVMDPFLRRGPIEACLVRSAQSWRFPPAREPYSLELTVQARGEPKP